MTISKKSPDIDDDYPTITREQMKAGTIKVAGRVVQNRGRPGQDKVQVTLRLDRATVERFRAGGPGWQTRINEALRKADAA